MLGGAGDRMLALAGREADIFSFSVRAGVTPGLAPEHAFSRRIQVLREAAGDRFGDIELNLFVAAVGASWEEVDFTIVRQASGLDDDKLTELPGVLVGSPREITDRLHHYRDELGVSYISVMERMAAFADVIEQPC
jgi:alkanesulfonate monooxygenase SsuD/methylene tetrahydromethanopterin reductase-like flavin-dependent oxidoreductase (luciferase family)